MSDKKIILSQLSAEHLPVDFQGRTGLGECSIVSPDKITVESSLEEILVFARKNQATDIHLSAGTPIFFKKNGVLTEQTKIWISAEQVKKLIDAGLTEQQREEFYSCGDIELVYVVEGAGRFRFTITKKSPGWDFTIRLIPMRLYSFEESGMPQQCRELTRWAQGMILVTGPIGCGKTTTLSVLCEMINQSRPEHMITIEQPIEYVFTPQKAQITQREIKLHTLSRDNALRSALRQDPDIIIISELRDPSTIQLAATAAETGHLVLGTLNTNDAAQTILRIINSFPSIDRSLVQNMISESLRGIICQQLVPKKDGTGVVPAYELLLVNSAVSNLIRKGNIEQLVRIIATGAAEGMLPMDKSLMQLLKGGIITWEEAYKRSVNKRDFEKLGYMRFA
ncbi:MAG: PilT/PilU family type 4a pilus ATPase [Candidatus Omnitrophica bacterium]|nr:PilT/PilU family type 4a pilus ATPase [Candidatus Omnitrophota bacterium]